MYTAFDFALYTVSKCINEDRPISNLQLQKILYYIQKAFLDHNSIAFSDEIEAWPFGPVVPNVYYYFCGYGAMPISNVYSSISIPDSDAEIVDGIIEEKRELDPWDMVAETHKAGGAWDQIYCNGAGNHKVIPVRLIQTAG